MFCTNCGKENQQEAKFCYHCGHKIALPDSQTDTGTSVEESQIAVVELLEQDIPERKIEKKPEQPKSILPDPAPEEEPSIGGNYFSKHWRGDYSLGVSYWLNYVLISAICTGIVTVLIGSDYWKGLDIRAHAYGLILLYAVLIPLVLWQVVGTFRSASKHVQRGGKLFWATAVHILVIIGFLRFAAQVVTIDGPVLLESFQRITSGPDIPAYELRVMREGKELELAGGMPFGTADAVRNILDATPTIKTIHLNNSGGLIEEGINLAKLISNRQLITFTSDLCASSCTIAFVAGQERYLGKNGFLGFHSASFGSLDGTKLSELNYELRGMYKQYGVSNGFIDKALSISSTDLWKPTQAELINANIVDEIVNPDNFALSGFSSWRDQKKIDDILTSTPALKAVSKYDPSFYKVISNIVFEGIQAGKSLNELKFEVRSHLLPRVIERYLPVAPNKELVAYWDTQIDEMEYLLSLSADHCVNFAYPDMFPSHLDLNSLLPKEMAARDVQALANLIKSASLSPVLNESTALAEKDLEKVALKLMIKGEDYLLSIGSPEEYKNKPDILCNSLLELYYQVFALPPNRVGPVLRYMLKED
ncbi:zinc-ribbon domain-containing protein [Neptuniibacter sp. PT8_73]|uniref:zinc-ribbon domain-containing protein n=1 Tax=Neptuniibacter sp. PT8_73 TaxID=3398206 RepID=UPI0039F4CF52